MARVILNVNFQAVTGCRIESPLWAFIGLADSTYSLARLVACLLDLSYYSVACCLPAQHPPPLTFYSLSTCEQSKTTKPGAST